MPQNPRAPQSIDHKGRPIKIAFGSFSVVLSAMCSQNTYAHKHARLSLPLLRQASPLSSTAVAIASAVDRIWLFSASLNTATVVHIPLKL